MSAMQPPPLSLSPLERPAFAHLFSLADPAKSGKLTGDAAVAFFSRARPPLDAATLGHIWSLSDSANNGFLIPASFSIALRLIGHAQRGEPVDEAAIHKPGLPPTFEGVTLPAQASSGSTFAPSNRFSTVPDFGVATVGNIDITAADRARYVRIFAGANPVNGLLDGDKAKDIFVKSKLPFDKLGAIWGLADTRSRGALDLTDFIIGMYFIQHTMSGKLNSIPSTLPAGLYEQAAAGNPAAQLPASPIPRQMTGGSASGAIPRQLTGQQAALPHHLTGQGILSPVQRQMTGQGTPSSLRVGSPTPSGFASPAKPNFASHLGGSAFGVPQQEPWAVTAADKAKSDRFFDGLDTEQTGALDGQTVVPFFVQSGLGEAVLAHIWDLSDITQSGSLSRDEFAVSMYLIQGKIAGRELPDKLPANLVPPSLRGQSLPEAVNPQESVTQRDLFSLMDDDELPAPSISAASAFVPASQLQRAPSMLAARVPPAPAPTAQPITAGPFDDDFFGGSAPQVASPQAALTPVATGTSQARAAATAPPPIQNGSAEIGNKQIQLESTSKAVDALQQEHSQIESFIAAGATSLADLENRLTSVRATHETESKLVADLQEKQRAQSAELQKLQQESISEESELSKLRAEKAEIEQIVLKEREDVRDLKRRMTEVQAETKELKTTLEKLKKDARQSKGLLAISKKQLATAEGEREKTKEEIGAAERGEVVEGEGPHSISASDTLPEPHVTSREGSLGMPGANAPVVPPDVTSPSSVRSLNPFDRAGQTDGAASPASHSTALGVGAGLGAVAAATAVASTTGFDDAFGQSTSSKEATLGHPAPFDSNAATAFDDEFGGSFAPAIADASRSTPQTAGVTAFDDAFSSLDPPAGGKASSQPEIADASDVFGSSFAPVAAPADMAGEAQDFTAPSQDAQAAHADPEGSISAPADLTSAAEDVEKSTPFGEYQTAKAAPEEPDSSDDEEEEPEDLDAEPVRGISGTSQESSEETSAPLAAVTDTTSSSERPTQPLETPAQAADRFPELDDDEPAFPGGLSVVTEPSSVSRDLGADSSLTAPAQSISKRSSLAPTDGYGTDAGEGEFHDAETGALSPTRDDFVEAQQSPSAQNAVIGSAFSTRSEASDAGALRHERFTTAAGAFDDAFGADDTSAAPAIPGGGAEVRPSSPTKTRRAPPPAPVRGAGSSVVSGGAGADAFGSTPVAPGTNGSTAAPTPAPASFDDFDAAFEDLGAPAAASSATGVGHTSETSTAFDDAFGQDADFDFVPSFSNPSASSAQGSGAGGASSSAFASAFDEFDSSFPSTQPGSGLSQPVTGNVSGASNSGSGFSFEDAFAPSQSEVLPPAAAPTSGAPALPARQATDGAAKPTTSKAALPDDAPPVKQLCGMGFDRDAVIKALEKSNYRTERALEKLLAGAS